MHTLARKKYNIISCFMVRALQTSSKDDTGARVLNLRSKTHLLHALILFFLPGVVRRPCWWTSLSWASKLRPLKVSSCGVGRAWSVLTTSHWPSWMDVSRWPTTSAPNRLSCDHQCGSTPTTGSALKPAGMLQHEKLNKFKPEAKKWI